MSRRVGKDIKRLCRDLAYAAATYLCPVVRDRERAPASDAPHRRNQIERDAHGKRAEAARMLVERLWLFSRMMGSAPAAACQPVPAEDGIEVFVHRLSEQEHRLGLSDAGMTCPGPDRRNERPRKSGLELIRLTLNLARGNIEDSSHFVSAPA